MPFFVPPCVTFLDYAINHQHFDCVYLSDVPDVISALLRGSRLTFPSGMQVRYDNQGFRLAGLLIERVSGISDATFLRQHIFAPLKMVDTSYLDETRAKKNRALGYTQRDGG